MAKKIKDTDYLMISARIRALENGLLTREKTEQLLNLPTEAEAAKLLHELGYPEMDVSDPESIDSAISDFRKKTLSELSSSVPDTRYIDVFKIKYDYHNLKALMKAEFMGVSPDSMLMDMGRISVSRLKDTFKERNFDNYPTCLGNAAVEALDVLAATRDPQLSDILLDRFCYHDMDTVAKETGSEFLCSYVKVQIDAVNLRSLVRSLRMGKSSDFLQNVIIDGGNVPADAVLKVGTALGSGIEELYCTTVFREAAEVGAKLLKGGALTTFEKLCDDAVSDYLSGASFVPFGEAPLLAYLAARETEYTNIRILLLGRNAGLPSETIQSRLRASCL